MIVTEKGQKFRAKSKKEVQGYYFIFTAKKKNYSVNSSLVTERLVQISLSVLKV